jgi:hypothetical protein
VAVNDNVVVVGVEAVPVEFSVAAPVVRAGDEVVTVTVVVVEPHAASVRTTTIAGSKVAGSFMASPPYPSPRLPPHQQGLGLKI